MNILNITKSWDGMNKVTSLAMISNVILTTVVLILGVMVYTNKPVVTLVPPHLTEEAQVGISTADAQYLMSWGLYFANMTGNVTPTNVRFVADAISPIVSSEIYPALRRQLYALAADPLFSERGGSVSFETQDIDYDSPSNKVFVTGEQVSKTSAGKQKGTKYVYEMQFEIQNRRPLLVAVDHYQGQPRTAKWMRNQSQKSERRSNDEELEGFDGGELWFDESVRYEINDKSAVSYE